MVRIRAGPRNDLAWSNKTAVAGPAEFGGARPEDRDNGEMGPQPELYEGPILEDLAKAAGTGGAVGGVAGFMLGSLFHAVRPVDPLKVGSWGAGLMSTFGVWIVLWSRILG